MSKTKDKRLVYVPIEIVEEVKEISRRRGESLSLFVGEVLKLAVTANSLGYSPGQAAEFLEIMRAQRNLGGAFVPKDVLKHLNNQANGEKEDIHDKWYESGKWHGKYIKEKFKDPIETFKKFLKATRWDLNEVEVSRNKDTVKFRCISTLLTGEETEWLAKFIEGGMHSLGYCTEKCDALKGMILLDFKK